MTTIYQKLLNKSGEDKLVGFLVGQLMKQSNGSVNPGMAKELLLKELEG